MNSGGEVERTRRRRADVKLRLQAALLEQVDERSFSEVKVEEIAAAAGLSRSAFYFYYADKRELLIDSAREAAGQLLEQADRWWRGDGDPGELIRAGLSGVAELWNENAGVFKTAVEVATYDAEVSELWNGLVERFVEGTAELIRAEQADGRIRNPIDPEQSARVLTWGVERGLYQLVTRNGMTPEDFVETTARLWVGALYSSDGAS